MEIKDEWIKQIKLDIEIFKSNKAYKEVEVMQSLLEFLSKIQDAEKRADEEKIKEIVQNALEKSVTEDKTVYNEDQLFELLGRMKLVENITEAIAKEINK